MTTRPNDNGVAGAILILAGIFCFRGRDCGRRRIQHRQELAMSPEEIARETLDAVALAMIKATAKYYGDPQPVNPDLTLTRIIAVAAIEAYAASRPAAAGPQPGDKFVSAEEPTLTAELVSIDGEVAHMNRKGKGYARRHWFEIPASYLMPPYRGWLPLNRTESSGWNFVLDEVPASDAVMTTLLIAVDYGEVRSVGEAYYLRERDEWWWANTNDGDYHASRIDGRVYAWQPMPAPPTETGGGT